MLVTQTTYSSNFDILSVIELLGKLVLDFTENQDIFRMFQIFIGTQIVSVSISDRVWLSIVPLLYNVKGEKIPEFYTLFCSYALQFL